ncbi:MAG: YceI family protein [Bacteroidia bacterium]|nr:YceI family protein [Bacteroidia bacterium]
MNVSALIRSIFSFLFLALTISLQAQESRQVNQASVSFFIKNAGIEVDGSMKGFSATIRFSPDALATSFINAELQATTLNTGISSRDEHLKNKDYFNVAQYPKIVMESTGFRASGEGFIGTFRLTMKGTTRVVELPFRVTKSGGGSVFQGTFTIDRLDYGIGESSWILSDEVRIEVRVEAR